MGDEPLSGSAYSQEGGRVIPKAPDRSELCANPCACGAGGTALLRHYETVLCRCGQTFWALRPRKNGPLVLVPHPGFAEGCERLPKHLQPGAA